MAQCRICESSYEPFINFGKMPIANGFLPPGKTAGEYFFEMKVGFCGSCHMVQLIDQPAREQMFHENYAFFSSTSTYMAEHFKRFAESVRLKYLQEKDPFVVEIGSNDGIMIGNFKSAGIRHLGVEPSKNVAEVAKGKGINTVSEFFDEALATKVIAEYGQADAILSANVMCHIPYMHSVVGGIKKLLKPKGIFQFEDPYLAEIVEKTSYDQIYDEHVFYFSVHSVEHLFAMHGMEVIDVVPQEVHGGSMRYIIGHKGAHPQSQAVASQKAKEKKMGLDRAETYDRLRLNIEKSRRDLMAVLNDLKEKGVKVVGYGATSKSTTVTNYCGITPEHIAYVSDTTPIKQGKLTPGAHIPVKSYEEFKGAYPKYALLFAWNHAKEIMAKETGFMESGGKWITYVPEVKVTG